MKVLLIFIVLIALVGNVSTSSIAGLNINQLSVIKTGHISNFIKKALDGSANGAFLGDSITVGGGTSDPTTHGYAYQVTDKLHFKYGNNLIMDNHGHGGYKVSRLLSEVLPTEIIPNNYDLVVVEAGTNDWNYSTPLTQFQSDYRDLIETIISKTHADILCVGIGWFNDWKSPTNNPISETEYNKIIQKICADHNIGYVDVRSAMMNSEKAFEDITYAPDRVHPNDVGSSIWANEVFTWFDFQGFMVETKMKRFTTEHQWATESGITYSGKWNDSGPYASTFDREIRQSSSAGATATYDFTGDKVKLYLVRDRDNGQVKITLDGNVIHQAFDCYSPTFNFSPLTIESAYGNHELKVEVLSTKNVSSSGKRIALSLIDNYVPR